MKYLQAVAQLLFFSAFTLYLWEWYADDGGFWIGVIAVVNFSAVVHSVLVLREMELEREG